MRGISLNPTMTSTSVIKSEAQEGGLSRFEVKEMNPVVNKLSIGRSKGHDDFASTILLLTSRPKPVQHSELHPSNLSRQHINSNNLRLLHLLPEDALESDGISSELANTLR